MVSRKLIIQFMKCWAGVFLALACQAQQELPPETLLLAKIKAKVAENLSRLPNFTCTETIQRSLWYRSTATPEMVDTVRLEVAFVQSKELYGWPGAARIDEPDITKMVGGSIGNGYFALFLNNIFLVSSTTFHYVGHVKLDGRESLRYDYTVPPLAKAYRLRSARGEAAVGYHGSIWVPDGQVDPARINVIADDVPTALGYSAATSLLDYGPTTIGSHTYFLPVAAEFTFTSTEGTENRSRLSFRTCHEFVGESVVKFNQSTPASTAPLPAGFTVDADLITPIDPETSAGGDAVEFTLRDAIKINDRVVVPKGAKLSGRIAHLTRTGATYALDFVFTSIVFEDGQVDLSSRENSATVQNWPKIRQSTQLSLKPGTRLTLQSRLGEPAK
jgi:hypothetical protein